MEDGDSPTPDKMCSTGRPPKTWLKQTIGYIGEQSQQPQGYALNNDNGDDDNT